MSGLAAEGLDGVPSARHSAPASGRSPRTLIGVGLLVTAFLLVPLAALAADAAHAGWSEISSVLFRPLSGQLFANTLLLALTVTPLCAVIGTGLAWLTVRSTLPGRRVWTVLLVLPVAMPDFVVGYAWHTIAPTMNPLAAATLVMVLSNYPLVFLPVSAALRRADPALDETARGLGVGAWRTFFRVTAPGLLPAVTSGCLVVLMTLISEFGAFEIVRFQTFTTEIFTEFQFDPEASAALSIPLVLLALLILGGESLIPRRPTVLRATGRRATPTRLGVWRGLTVVGGLCVLGILAVGVPIGTLVYWIGAGQRTTLPAQATLAQATGSTLMYCGGGALLAVLLALPIAFLSVRDGGRLAKVLERGAFLVLALPGVVVALSLVYFTVHVAYPLYETSGLLIVAYGFLTFPLALSCLLVSVRQAPAALSAAGRSLGRGSVVVFFRVTLPLIAPGLMAGFCLVFLTATTELTATLVLAPIGTQTLTTQFWAFQSESAYSAAAPYALMIIAISMIPGALLALWFGHGGRIPARAPSGAER
jgi:iron(III) transport system permease protein